MKSYFFSPFSGQLKFAIMEDNRGQGHHETGDYNFYYVRRRDQEYDPENDGCVASESHEVASRVSYTPSPGQRQERLTFDMLTGRLTVNSEPSMQVVQQDPSNVDRPVVSEMAAQGFFTD